MVKVIRVYHVYPHDHICGLFLIISLKLRPLGFLSEPFYMFNVSTFSSLQTFMIFSHVDRLYNVIYLLIYTSFELL